ncbi:hypothetical protein GC093_24360 [Paenibacillus sp. LMG 31456]|uniref:Uncharacterized protein n=1 Tax=Paenibacillus foliorum TaxID=2654974 RepID=A0A972GT15_9BACL|nr:hypothetical protein [Paenibacillus foliorum]NOU96326.1 hypothetical protein [Paenibacillus foliorum]
MAFTGEAISLADLKTRMEEEVQLEDAVKAKLEAIIGYQVPMETMQLQPIDVMNFAKELTKNWSYFELEHKKTAIQTLCAEIVVNAVGKAIGGPGRRVPCEIISFKTN